MRYKAIGRVGMFWTSTDIDLGTFHLRWFAIIRARLWLFRWRYSTAEVRPE